MAYYKCKWCGRDYEYNSRNNYEPFCSMKCERDSNADFPRREEERQQNKKAREKQGDKNFTFWLIIIVIIFTIMYLGGSGAFD